MKCPGCKKDVEVERDRLAQHSYLFNDFFEFGRKPKTTYRQCIWSGQLVAVKTKTAPKEQMEMDFS